MALPDKFGSSGGVNPYEHKRGFPATDIARFGPPTEAGGFQGVLAGHIAEWNERGLGRAIGFMTPPETAYDQPRFHGAFYTLPLTDLTDSSILGANHRVLLIAPQEAQARFLVLRPKQYRADMYEKQDPQRRQRRITVNNALADEFRRFFQPNPIAHLDTSLDSDPIQVLAQFTRKDTPLVQSVVTEKELLGAEKESILEEALQNTHRMEAVRNATRETALVDIVGEADLAALGRHSAIFGQDMSDEAALLGDLGDDVADTLSAMNHQLLLARSASARNARTRHAEATDLFRRKVAAMSDLDVTGEIAELDFPFDPDGNT